MKDIDPAYTSWGCGRPMTHPDWCLPISFTHDAERAGLRLRQVAVTADPKDVDFWRIAGPERLLREYHERCDEQVLEAYGCLDAPIADREPAAGPTTYRGWETEYAQHGFGLWPEIQWTAYDPNGEGFMLYETSFADLCEAIDACLDD